MSLMKTPEASPSRVYAIFALTLQMPDRRVDMDVLKRLIAPQAFAATDRKETDFVGLTIPEAVSLGLIHQEDNILSVPDTLPTELLDHAHFVVALPHAIRYNVMLSPIGINEDLAKTIAWYMAQNPYQAPGNWRTVEEAMLKQLKSKMDCSSDARYGQFEDWAMYLGFASRIQKQLVPDPTRVIRHYLPRLFHDKRTHSVDTVVKRLAEICPVFEQGHYREWVREQYGVEMLQEDHLSQVTSFAWMRLHDERTIRLEKKSDADVYVFTENQDTHRYSEITWYGEEAEL